MTSFERFVVNLDTWPTGAFLRVALGLCIPPVFRLVSGGDERVWVALLLFLAVLLALRIVPVFGRRAFRFSAEAKDLWFQRRGLGKRYDSYQWQKLFWMGLGMLPYALTAHGLGRGEIALVAICLIGGGAGLLLWRRTSAGQPNSGAGARTTNLTSAVAPAPQ